MVGTGSVRDPKRPLFVPAPALPRGTPVIDRTKPVDADFTAITGFSYHLSDDGKYALVEFIARDPQAFQEIRCRFGPM